MSFEFGQLVRGYVRNKNIDHGWMQTLVGQYRVEAAISERTKILLGTECLLGFSLPQERDPASSREQVQRVYFHQAEVTYANELLGFPFGVEFGYFPFKYNPYAADLGEYLFRSGTYPPVLFTSFDFPMVRLLGLHLSSTMFEFLHHDIILNSQTQMHPTMNFSLSYIAGCDIARIFNLGAGVSFAHLLSVNDNTTSPHNSSIAATIDSDTLMEADGVTIDTIMSDTTFVSFKGIKLMARASFDPKGLVRLVSENAADMFGKNDFVIYGEAAVIGLKNYPSADPTSPKPKYDTLSKRIPVMVGINIPTLKLLDVLAAEVEYYTFNYRDDYDRVYKDGLPLPNTDADNITEDNIKFAFYAKRDIGSFVTLSGQIARDHLRPLYSERGFEDKNSAISTKDHWYWMLRAMFRF
jgi:hypothetical protein